MKIGEVHIYGYGKLENVVITNLNSLSVFYGENEAGKSTIMSFIHSILFGFPTKAQSEHRYEPKTGGRYGGKLILHTGDQGKLIVERIKGKSTGDVSVILEDGTRGGEALLNEVLGRIDKSLYQSIFSFNLHGLQNIHHLKKEDLGRFLFSTGAIGTDRIYAIETMLQKELDEKFKPSGKKPIINEKLIRLKDVYRDLKNSEQKNEGYWRLIQQRDELEEELSLLAIKEDELNREQQKLNEWVKLEPIVKELIFLEGKLTEEPSVDFPIDGINRLEQVIQWMKPLEAQRERLDRKITELKEEIKQVEPDLTMLSNEEEIQDLLDRIPLLESLKEEENSLRIQLEFNQKQKREWLEKLHIPLDDKALEKIETSLFMKERVVKAQKKRWNLTEKKEELDRVFEMETTILEELENKISSCKSDMLSDQEFYKLEEHITLKNSPNIEGELSQVKQTIDLLQITSKGNDSYPYPIFLLSLVGIFLGVFGWVKSELFLIIIGMVLIIMVLISTLFSKSKKNEKMVEEKVKELRRREKELVDQAQATNTGKSFEYQIQWEKEKRKREEFQDLKIKWNQHNQQYEQVITDFEKWETEVAENDEELKAISRKLFLPEDVVKTYLAEAFDLLVSLKSTVQQEKAILLQIESKVEAINKISNRLEELGMLLVKRQIPVMQLAAKLKTDLKEEQQKNIVYREKSTKLQDSIEELDKVQSEIKQYLDQKNELFRLANSSNEEDYRKAGNIFEKQQSIKKRIDEIKRQMAFTSLSEKERNELLAVKRIEELIKDKRAEIESLYTRREEVLKQLSKAKHEISILEEGGQYSELLHKYTQLRAELDHDAKEWAKYAIAKELLTKTVKVFNEEKLPIVIKKAEEYLTFLTEGNYQRIIPKENGSGFMVYRNDYTVFEANELSQATMEQVYVSIRFALVTTIYKNRPFPIIIDDSFVNFDHVRTSRVIDLLKSIANNQVLFFTCHRHLLDYFSNKQIIHLEENPVPHS